MDNRKAVPPEAGEVLEVLRRCFSNSLVAVYLHGSAVSGGLRPGSDVDLLAVVSGPVSEPARAELLERLLELSGCPGRRQSVRPVELAVFGAQDLAAASYPAPCEFMYGEWLRDAFEAGEQPRPFRDPELTLVLAQARQEARALLGAEAERVLPLIPAGEIRRAMLGLLPSLLETLQGDERNVLLTLARMLRTANCGDFLPKDLAAEWAASRLSKVQVDVLNRARVEYLSGEESGLCAQSQEVLDTALALREQIESALNRLQAGSSSD